MNVATILLQGVLLGGLYALMATGLTLVFGIMRLVNLAHGDLIVVSAYLALLVVQGLNASPLVAFVMVLPLMAGLGYALQRGMLNGLLDNDPMRPLLATFGLAIIVQNTLFLLFSADTQILRAGNIAYRSIAVGGQNIGTLPLLTFIVALAVIAGLHRIMYRTRLGRNLRAASDDPAILDAMGVNHKHMYACASALAFATMCIAGILMSVRSNFDPFIGPGRLLVAFEIVVIGGLGSFWGMLCGGIIIGLAQVVGAAIDPGYQFIAGHIVFFVLLLLRPQGLFPKVKHD